MTLRRHQLAALAAVTLALTAARVAPAAPTKPAPAPAPAPTAAPRTEADGSTDVHSANVWIQARITWHQSN